MGVFRDEAYFGSWGDYRNEWVPDIQLGKQRPKEKKATGRPVSRRTEVEVEEIINLRELHAHRMSGGDRRPEQLVECIRKVESRGVALPEGTFSLQQQYYKVDGFGRLYTSGGSLQIITKEARAAALCGLGVIEWDMKNAQPSLLLRALRGCVDASSLDGEFPLLLRFRRNPDVWRERVAHFYGMPERDAKKLFLQIMFGGRTKPYGRQRSLPVVEALQWEFQYAQAVLLEKSALYKQISSLEKI